MKDFGAFIELPGFKRNGLVHKSHISNHAVEDAQDVLERNEKVWVKVVSIEEAEQRLGLSMKYVSQGDGTDLDPNHVQASMESSRARPAPRGKQPVHLEAVFDTKCTKCGGTGHLAFECFGVGKQDRREKAAHKYDLIEAGSDEEAPLPTAAAKVAARKPGDTQAFLWAMATGGTGPVAADEVPEEFTVKNKSEKGGKRKKRGKRGGKSRRSGGGARKDKTDSDLAKISSLAEAKSVLQMLDEKKEKKRKSRGSRGGKGRR